VYAEVSDNLAGIGSVDLNYYSQTTNQFAFSLATPYGNGYLYTVFLPPFAATGDWLPNLVTTDLVSNYKEYSYEELVSLGFDLKITVNQIETELVEAGGTLSTDAENNGVSVNEPYETSVTTPSNGEVSITQVTSDVVSYETYHLLDQTFAIRAPDGTVEDPLILNFVIDSSALEGQTAQTLLVFRNGTQVGDCLDPTVTNPDPCVAYRNTLSGGDVELIIRTSQASVWTLGYSTTGPSYSFQTFKRPVVIAPNFNQVNAGRVIPVKFALGGNFGLDVLPSEIAMSQRIDCTTQQPIGEPSPIATTQNGGLSINDEDTYHFNWKTLSSWEATCRTLSLSFNNGESVDAYFDF
jgi:hypothetical protein